MSAASDLRAPRAVRAVDPIRYTPGFSYRGSRLFCEGVSVEKVAARFGTPAYLYSRASIVQAYRRLDSAFGALPHTICYAVKANSNLGILRVFAALGAGFDIVSGGELYRLRRIGVPGKRIVFSGVGKSREEIREALRARILLFNVESPTRMWKPAGTRTSRPGTIATSSASTGTRRAACTSPIAILAGFPGRGSAPILVRRF